MNCFGTSKENTRRSRAERRGESETPVNHTYQSSLKRRLYKKKGERSSVSTTDAVPAASSGAIITVDERKFPMSSDGTDGHGQSKNSEQNSLFCWKRSSKHKTSVSMEYGTDVSGLAYMPVSKNSPHYNMNHPRRGKAVIFNFDHWDNTSIPELEIKPRKGSTKDKNDLTSCLKKLDFEVTSYDNVGHKEFWKILDGLRDEDHTDADCLVVAIFTHGERNTVIVRDGTQIPVNLIWENFEAHVCASLAGKPKIFIIQACRGRNYDSGTTLAPGSFLKDREQQIKDVTDSAIFTYVIPNSADILVAFSSPWGQYAWRNPERGSWFIQSICKVFDQHAYKMDLQSLFTTVAREVALNYESNTPEDLESHKKKQVTSTCSTLIRAVQFTPKRVFVDDSVASSLVLPMRSTQLTEENKIPSQEIALGNGNANGNCNLISQLDHIDTNGENNGGTVANGESSPTYTHL